MIGGANAVLCFDWAPLARRANDCGSSYGSNGAQPEFCVFTPSPRTQADAVPLHKTFIDASDVDLSKVEPNGKVALVTGITGQDGSYLAELLLQKGYVVHGIVRRSSSFNTGRIEHMYRDKHMRPIRCVSGLGLTKVGFAQLRGRVPLAASWGRTCCCRLFLEYGDMTDSSNLCEIMARVKPHEIYNLAAQSHVKVRSRTREGTPQHCLVARDVWRDVSVSRRNRQHACQH